METVAIFAVVGFVAQLVDGALGMAYGLTASSLLLAYGLSPALASASVHTAEVFTTAVSGASHWRLGNVDRTILIRLAVPGAIGGALGASVLASVSATMIKPVVSAYLLIMGLVILFKALRPPKPHAIGPGRLRGLAFVGATLDAIGGGGWGPIVTSNLVGWGLSPRLAVGTANAAEFFVTIVIAGVLLPEVNGDSWPVIAGLIIGGVVAAPLAAYGARIIPVRALMVLVGLSVTGLSLNDLGRAFWS